MKVDGLLNIWGCYASFFICFYFLFYWVNQIVRLPFPLGNINKVGLAICIVVSPLLAVITYTKLNDNLSGYVECSSLRKVSLHYSSHTYAISKELCLSKAKEM